MEINNMQNSVTNQAVDTPSAPTKAKRSRISVKTAFIIILLTLSVVTLTVILIVQNSLPEYHYNKAAELIEKGKYDKAYSHMLECLDYKDTRNLIENFKFENFRNVTILTDKHNNILDSYETSQKYTYDEYGNVISSHTVRNDGQGSTVNYKNEYNKSGKLIRRYSLGSDGKVFEEETFEYDKNDNLVSNSVYNKIYNTPNDIIIERTYNYDGHNRLTKLTNNDIVGNNVFEFIYQYNELGVITSETRINKKRNDFSVYNYFYEYSDNQKIVYLKLHNDHNDKIEICQIIYSDPVYYNKK